MVEPALELEKEFKISISDEAAEDIKTLEEAKKHILDALNKKEN